MAAGTIHNMQSGIRLGLHLSTQTICLHRGVPECELQAAQWELFVPVEGYVGYYSFMRTRFIYTAKLHYMMHIP